MTTQRIFSVHGWKYLSWLEVSFLGLSFHFDGEKYHVLIVYCWKYHTISFLFGRIFKNLSHKWQKGAEGVGRTTDFGSLEYFAKK